MSAGIAGVALEAWRRMWAIYDEKYGSDHTRRERLFRSQIQRLTDKNQSLIFELTQAEAQILELRSQLNTTTLEARNWRVRYNNCEALRRHLARIEENPYAPPERTNGAQREESGDAKTSEGTDTPRDDDLDGPAGPGAGPGGSTPS